jgi:aldehyde:ferredoxin oxidoreductase
MKTPEEKGLTSNLQIIITNKMSGYAGRILRVDLSKEQILRIPLDKRINELYIGGRGYDAKILFDEIKLGINPLDPQNILCISTGPITGLLGPTTGRVNVATISPLTGIYGNSNAGTNFGPELKYAGYDRLIISGKAKTPKYLFIEDDKVELRDASHLWGKGVFDTILTLKEEIDEEIKVAAIGPAAEKGVLYGCIIFDYWDAAGRTGTGTVMASKNLKAIAVKGSGGLRVHNSEKYMEVAREGWEAVLGDPGFKTGEHSALGTAVVLGLGNAQGWLPTRNFQESQFEYADEISGEEFRDKYSIKEAPIPGGRACMCCPNRCKRFGKIVSGKYAGTRGNLEFEGIGAFGSKCGVRDLDAVFHAFMLSTDYGMDCISCGNTIAMFMELHEKGILSHKQLDGLDLHFGNSSTMIEAIHRIGNVAGNIGKLGSQGTARMAQQIPKANYYSTSIKGMETIACDPRVAKGFGFGYAVASRGSDHLRAHPVWEMLRMPREVGKELFGDEEVVELTSYRGKVKMVVWHENLAAITDSIGSCRFMHASFYAQYPIPELLYKYGRHKKKPHSIKYHEWLSWATGMDIDYKKLIEIGERIITLERAINLRFGIRKKDDTLPRRFFEEQIPKGRAKGEVFDKKEFERMLDEYYEIRGWDKKEGLLLKKKLIQLGMKDVKEVLEREKLVI